MSSAQTAPERQFRGRLARSMLVILMLLSLAPLLLMGSLAYLQSRTLLRDQVYTLLKAVVNAQSSRLASQVNTGNLLLSRAVYSAESAQAIETLLAASGREDPNFVAARRSIFDRLQTVNQPIPYFNQYLIVNPDGVIQAATRSAWEDMRLDPAAYAEQGTTDTSAQPYALAIFADDLTAQQAGGDLYPHTAEAGPYENGEFIIVTVVPYLDSTGRQVATVLAIAESHTIQAFIRQNTFYSTNHYFITSNNHYVGISPYPDSLNKLITLFPSPAHQQTLQAAIPTGDAGTVSTDAKEILSFQDIPVIAAYTWIPELHSAWVAEVTQESVYSHLRSLLNTIIVLVLFAFILMAFIIWQVTQRLTLPLLELANIVRQFAAGSWEQRAVVNRNDEIGLLSASFNHLADELTDLYRSLEIKVEERTNQIRTVTEISQIAITSENLENLLQRTVQLIIERFKVAYAAAYLVDQPLKKDETATASNAPASATLHQAAGSPETIQKETNKKIELTPLSLIGWVVNFKRPRVMLYERSMQPASAEARSTSVSGSMSGSRAEAAIPVTLGEQVLGVINLQTNDPGHLSDEKLNELQTLANYIAPAIQNFHLLESTQVDLRETNLLYKASHHISQAENETQIFQTALDALAQTPYTSAILIPRSRGMQVYTAAERDHSTSLSISQSLLEAHLAQRHGGTTPAATGSTPDAAPIVIQNLTRLIQETKNLPLPIALLEWAQQLNCETIAFLPVWRAKRLIAVLALGLPATSSAASTTSFASAALQPYINLVELVTTTLEKIQALQSMQKSLAERHTLDTISQAISGETDQASLYPILHQQIRQVVGDVNFLIALYDNSTNLIEIPYMADPSAQVRSVEPFPAGEGLTSIIIRTRRPLLLQEDIERKTAELGAKIVGKPAKSWLGVPLLVSGEVIGAMIVQDLETANRFTEEDQRLLTTLAAQVAIFIRNARLFEATRRQAEREHILNEISGKIRRSVDMKSILQATAEELGHVLGARRARIEIQVENLIEGKTTESPAEASPEPPADLPVQEGAL